MPPSRKSHFRFLICLFAIEFGIRASVLAETKVALTKVAEGLVSPVVLLPLNQTQNLVADQIGIVYLLDEQGLHLNQPVIDVTSRMPELTKQFDERGLLGLALHPKFRENQRVFLLYNAPLRAGVPTNWNSTIHLSEFQIHLENGGARIDPNSERVLLEIDKPYFNHNGGSLAFGPDGFLYISVGDGGNANDTGIGHSPQGNGQDTQVLLGKMLRIDVDHGNPYAIPDDNPFARGGGRPEIYAYGLRNPWRMSFDSGGQRQLFVGDIGQDMFEEVDIIVKGGNYGWNIREGLHCFNPKDTHKPLEDCPKIGARGEPLIDPIFEYRNAKVAPRDAVRGTSVIGGFIYRGKAFPELEGKYVFADWSRNFVVPDGVLYVASASEQHAGRWTVEPLPMSGLKQGRLGLFVMAMGRNANGELYILTNITNGLTGHNGKIFELVPGE